ncbi:MAG: hypothetical protein GEU73_11740 [Chloroflexi bacterium]|nr:hypothetical protein [Chloroflexota bacterium]
MYHGHRQAAQSTREEALATQQDVQELREKVALSCRMLGNRGVTKGSFGHVSARIAGTDRILIKAKGPDEEALEFATARDVITIDIEGAVLEAPAGLDAPNETAMHLAVYRARSEVMSVIHSHPDWVVLLTACEKPIVPLYGAYDPQGMRMCVDGIPIYPRSITIINDELGEDLMKVMGDKDVCLLRGHGMTTAGRSVEESTSKSLTMFELARMNYLAHAIGTPRPVPDGDIDEYRGRMERGERRRGEGRSATGEPSFWRYNRKLLERQLL